MSRPPSPSRIWQCRTVCEVAASTTELLPNSRRVKAVLGVRIFRQYHVMLLLVQPRDKGLAAFDRVVIVERAVKNPDRPIGDIAVGEIGSRAVRVERDVDRELYADYILEI